MGSDRLHRLRRAADACRAPARALRRAETVARRAGVRGRGRGQWPVPSASERRDPLVLALPPGSPPKPSVRPLRDLEQIGLVTDSSGKVFLLRVLNEHGISPRFASETYERGAVVPMMLAGVGAAIVGSALGRYAEALGAVVCRLEPLPRQGCRDQPPGPPISRCESISRDRRGAQPAAHAYPAVERATHRAEPARGDSRRRRLCQRSSIATIRRRRDTNNGPFNRRA